MMRLPLLRLLLLFFLLSAWPALNLHGADTAFFENKIRPLLLEKCAGCHGADEQESDLRLDTPAGILQGGAAGASISPGKPQSSLLLTAVKQRGDLKMPPDEKLSDQEIRWIEQWIQGGAPMPQDGPIQPRRSAIDWEQASEHWAFQPLDGSPIPSVQRKGWAANPIDLYLLNKLEAQSLSPSPRAAAEVLARRMSFDLTGLPPTEFQVAALTRDDSPTALAAFVDELLASPAYGERWGRHWLDVARYADSNGLDENIAHGNAWRYRDFVVESLNQDVPYDHFVRQQVAGDLLPVTSPTERRRNLIATGFMSLGPKVLAEVDEAKMEMDIIDEQIDTLGAALLGLTLGCARCHDHKFDPVSTRDYYALAGILKSTRTMEHFTKIARWNEVELPMNRREAKRAEAMKSEIASLESDLKRWQELAKAKPAAAGESQEDPQAKIKEITASLKQQKEALADVASAMALGEREPTNLQVHVRGSHLTLGDEAPRRFLQVLQGDDEPLQTDGSGRLELANWLTTDGPQQWLLARVIANRVWRWHWGRGIVESVDNFGRLGQAPTHPKLLDYLASELIAGQWSIKRLHRLILTSNAYQQASTHRDDAMAIDSENRWHWRFEPRRLEAEAIRDAMLLASGRLDPKMGGSLLHVGNREFFFNHTSEDATRYDQPVRSLYLPVVRNNLFDGFMLFDYSDASTMQGNRVHSVTAPQALYLLNADLVDRSAIALAQKTSLLLGPERVSSMYQAVFSRSAQPSDVELGLAFVTRYAKVADDQRAWRAFAHALFASNEFLYLR